MSDPVDPATLSYPGRSEPDWSWQLKLERNLMALPVAHRHPFSKRRYERILEQASFPGADLAPARVLLRREGLTNAALLSWCRESIARGVSADSLQGALAIINGHAVQASPVDSQLDLVANACQAIVLSGQQVHVVFDVDQANEFAEALCSRLNSLQLTAAILAGRSSGGPHKEAYDTQVVIGNVRDFMLDYLEDQVSSHEPHGEIPRRLHRVVSGVQASDRRVPGLPFGIVLGAQRVLIEHAVEPVSIVGSTDPGRERLWAREALALAEKLEEVVHYELLTDGEVIFTACGQERLETLAAGMAGAWRNTARRSRDVALALRALHLRRDEDYRVINRGVELSRSVKRTPGLVQLLQAREGVAVTGRPEAKGRLSVQRFFNRYAGLAAVDEDLRESRSELWHVYGLAYYPFSAPVGSQATTGPLNDSDQELVGWLGGHSPVIARRVESALATLRRRQQLKSGRRLRAALLQLDNQADTLTAFTGKSE